MARRILWRQDVPFAARESIAALVRHHLAPFHFLERDDPRRKVYEVSQTTRCDHLAILAEADSRGRFCADLDEMLENVVLFVDFCGEHNCLTSARRFASDHSRFLYFRNAGRDPDYLAHDDCRCEVVLMSGLPGSGKDHWIREHFRDRPVVSLDILREQLDVSPASSQGAVVAQARELARVHLRASRSFVWNATNLSRKLREESIGLFDGRIADRSSRSPRRNEREARAPEKLGGYEPCGGPGKKAFVRAL